MKTNSYPKEKPCYERTLRLERSLDKMLHDAAMAKGQSFPALCRDLLRAGLRDEDQFAPLLPVEKLLG